MQSTGLAAQPAVVLTDRQRMTLDLVSKGFRNSEIAGYLGVCERTVKWYVSELFVKFDVSNRAELAAVWVAEKDSTVCGS